MGELQNQASGPSAFGQIVGGDPGYYDVFGGTECGVEGARICLRDTEVCTTSDRAGQFVLTGLPEDADIEITFDKDGSIPVIRLLHTGATPLNLGLTRTVTLEGGRALLQSAGVTLDESLGSLVGVALAPSDGIGAFELADGVVMTLEPGGLRPLYSAGVAGPGELASDELVPSLEATRPGGWGYFANVPPGEYTLRLERDGQPCRQPLPGYGYGVDDSGNLRVRVVAGYQTAGAAALCQ